MPRKAKDTLDYLGAGECAQVLRELLKRHRDLRGEANEIAESLIDDVSVEEQAGEWVEMLERVVRESAKKKRERR